MSSSNTRYVVNFSTNNLSSLIRARSVIRGIEQQSYISFNSASRSLSHLEKQSRSSANQITRSMDRIGSSLRGLSGRRGGGFSLLGMFGGLSMISLGVGSLVGSVNLLHRAFIQTNTAMQSSRIMIEELLGSANQADGFINKMKDLSASFGMDLTETMNASRGMMQVMKQVGGGDVRPIHLEKMLKMIMAVSSMDLENRGLSYTAFSFKEAFQGMGRGDFRSLRNRLEINLGKTMELAITNAIKKGNLDEAIDLFDKGLMQIGINSDRLLKRLSSEGFLQNINRLGAYFLRTFQVLGEPLFQSLVQPFARFNNHLAQVFSENSGGIGYLRGLGQGIADAFRPAIDVMDNFFEGMVTNVKLNPKNNIVTAFVDGARGSLRALMSMTGLIKSFVMGIFGVNDNGNPIQGLIDLFKTLANFGDQSANTMDKMRDSANKLGMSLNGMVGKLAQSVSLIGSSIGGGNGFANIGNVAMGIPTSIMNTTSSAVGGVNSLGQSASQNGGYLGQALGAVGGVGGVLSIIGILSMLRNPFGAVKGMQGMFSKGSSAIGSSSAIKSAIGNKTLPTKIATASELAMAEEAIRMKSYIDMKTIYAKHDPKVGYGSQVRNIDPMFSRNVNSQAYKDYVAKQTIGKSPYTSAMQGIKEVGVGGMINAGLTAWMMKDMFKSANATIASKIPSLYNPLVAFGTKVGAIASQFGLLGIAVGSAIGAFAILKSASDSLNQANAQAKQDWRTAGEANSRLKGYKTSRAVAESMGVSIGQMNSVLKTGYYGRAVNKDNYEWFMEKRLTSQGRQVFDNVQKAYDSGLISPTDLKQMSPQMYDIFSQKDNKTVHSGMITLETKLSEDQLKQIIDKINKNIDEDKKKKTPKPYDNIDKSATITTTILGS